MSNNNKEGTYKKIIDSSVNNQEDIKNPIKEDINKQKIVKMEKEWEQYLNELLQASLNVAEYLKNNYLKKSNTLTKGIEAEIRYWNELLPELIKSRKSGFEKQIQTLIKYFFPNIGDFYKTFKQIYENVFESKKNLILHSKTALTQKTIIKEFILFLISPSEKGFLTQNEESLLQKIVDAFKSSNTLCQSEDNLKNLFVSSRVNFNAYFRKLRRYLPLIEFEREEKDPKTGNIIKKKYYQFTPEVLEFLVEKDILEKNNEMYYIKNEVKFTIDLFYAIILSHICTNERYNLNKYTIIGIISQFVLLFLLSSLPSISKMLEQQDKDKLSALKRNGYNSDYMDILPKSWLNDDVIDIYILPLFKCLAFMLGGKGWVKIIEEELRPPLDSKDKAEIEKYKRHKRLFKQFLTRFPTINKWILGEKVRVRIPVFVEIGDIITKIYATSEGNVNA
ncbi:MAG: hypothetical protein ACTSRZ_05930 [Promethearchaeota archaeon]